MSAGSMRGPCILKIAVVPWRSRSSRPSFIMTAGGPRYEEARAAEELQGLAVIQLRITTADPEPLFRV